MRTTYQAKDYDPAKVLKRYVRLDGVTGYFCFCEVGEDKRYDLRQGIVDSDELPEDVYNAAYERAGIFPSYVEWPL